MAELKRMLTQLGRPVRLRPTRFSARALSRVSEQDPTRRDGAAGARGCGRKDTPPVPQGTEPWLRRAGCAIPPADAPYLARLLGRAGLVEIGGEHARQSTLFPVLLGVCVGLVAPGGDGDYILRQRKTPVTVSFSP